MHVSLTPSEPMPAWVLVALAAMALAGVWFEHRHPDQPWTPGPAECAAACRGTWQWSPDEGCQCWEDAATGPGTELVPGGAQP